MGVKLYEENDIQDIANAIRSKNGLSDTYKVSQMSSAINALQNGAYNIDATIDGDFQTLDITDYDYTPTTPTLTVSATATSGVTYTHILGRLTFADINKYAKAISNASDIDNTTTDVYIDDGNNHYVLSIGDTICYTLSTDESMIDQIIGFNHDDLTSATAYGEATTTGKAGITFQMENCLNTLLYMMVDWTTNAGGWALSDLRTTSLPAIKLTMPSRLQSVIKMVDKKSANGGSTNYSETVTTSDDLFVLSEIEVFGISTYAQDGSNEGVQYKYWNSVTLASPTISDRNKIKYYDNSGTITAKSWGLRSAHKNSTNSFVDVREVGYVSTYNAQVGFSLAYCV